MSDFLSADIDELLNGEIETEEEPDINTVFDEYDRELMRFTPRSQKMIWPEPIRKRICTK